MASNTSNGIDGSTSRSQEDYATKDYKVSLRLTTADKTGYDNTKDWMLVMEFRCFDLLRIMKEGLFWTTSNVVPEGGWLGPTRGSYAKHHSWQRVWELREFPDREESQCRWVATATLYGYSWEALADFRLHTLHQGNVASSGATNKLGNCVFVYNRSPNGQNFNCFIDKLHPWYGSWWFWPMEDILDYDTLGYRGGGKTEASTGTQV
ncbi:hypothetical protein BR93DRAFT_962999 [Coniochaeta sp. PMI_546]|nr:hypothetical protein BR93DRAFT_962999 [Coniochaeta sp. PMI_546]